MPDKQTRQYYTSAFESVIAQLNKEQELAVNHIEGPMLVIAGPGTGKTHILTARIGRILQQTDAAPYNILCLTFTDAGVLAMRERLLEFIGPDAHKVHIYTYHSFCNTVIQENLEYFGRHDLEPLSDLERVEIIRRLLEQLPQEHPLIKGKRDIYYHEGALYDLFKRMKTENWTSEFIYNKIDAYLKALPEREDYIYKRKFKDFVKGDIKEAKLQEEVERMKKLRSAAALFPIYKEAMYKARRYDFDDMVLWVLKAFQENEALLRNYQEQYLYLLVDEYQDTNGTQNQVIQHLIEYWDKPNIFVVGDDDQSIFEFQGARLKNILDFYQKYEKSIELVLLKDNYRSSQNILDTSIAVINNNEKRMVVTLENLEKKLAAQNQFFATSTIKPHLFEYHNRLAENTDIVNRIEALHQEGFPLNEIAIIYAKHKQARAIIALLEKKKIPYNTKRRINILDLPMLQNLRLFLQYIAKEYRQPHSAEEELFQILHFDFLGISAQDIGRLSLYMAKHQASEDLYWRSILQDKKLFKLLKIEKPDTILEFGKLVDELIIHFNNYTTLKLLEKLINRSGLLKKIIHHDDKTWLLQVVATFFDFVKKETERHPRLTIYRLLETLRNMDANRIALGVNKTIYSDNGVNMLTAFGAKGLEFQYVFLLDCVKENWEPTTKGMQGRFTYPDTLTYSNIEDAMEARRRLFYVGMTRAKEQLYISYSKKDNKGKPLGRAVFIDEILEDTTLKIEEKILDKTALFEAQVLLLKELQVAQVERLDEATVNGLLANFALSASSLNRFLNCPLSFYYQYILRIPSSSSEAASYGTAMHFALRRLFDKMLLSETKTFPTEQVFIEDFEWEMKRQKGNFTKKEYQRRLKAGRSFLSKYYQYYIDEFPKKVKPELDIRNVVYKDVPLKGAIDLVEYLDKNYVHLIDYKTGSLDDKKLKMPTKAKPYGGNYWRQLVFYKILFDNYKSSNSIAQSGEIAYLETDKTSQFVKEKRTLSSKEVDVVGGMITAVWQKIKKHDFYQGCEDKNCKWCNFVKRNIMSDTYNDIEAEELDDL